MRFYIYFGIIFIVNNIFNYLFLAIESFLESLKFLDFLIYRRRFHQDFCAEKRHQQEHAIKDSGGDSVVLLRGHEHPSIGLKNKIEKLGKNKREKWLYKSQIINQDFFKEQPE